MVVALGDGAAVFGCALGVDLTRRDLQDQAKAQRRPWDAAKAFDASAPCGALARGLPPRGRASSSASTAICGRAACWRT